MLKISSIRTQYIPFNSTVFLIISALIIASIASVLSVKNPPTQVSAASCSSIYDPLPSFITEKVNRNKAIYQQVAQERGVPWEMLAAIHYRETNNSRVNPGNNQGIYQLYSIYQSNQTYQALARSSNGNEVSAANFLEQTRFAADFIQGKAVTSGTSIVKPRKLTTNETSISLIKNTLFSYNGRAYAYANQAATYGFNSSSQPYEGSPYVMNKFDCQRNGMGIITCDGCSTPSGTDTRYGAFTLYARLKSDSYWLSLVKQPLAKCTTTRVKCVWEFENEDTQKRFYTANLAERDAVYKLNFRPIGISFHTRNTPESGSTPVYRLYNLQEGWHFWTTNAQEQAHLVQTGVWRDEGVVFNVDPTHSNTGDPVRRLYTQNNGGRHIFTSNSNTVASLLKSGFVNEGVAFVSVSTNVQPSIPKPGYENVYRFQLKDSHFWTKSVAERNNLIRNGTTYEGVAWESQKGNSNPAYRLYSPQGKHFWTTSTHERNILRKAGYRDEGVGWSTSTSGSPTYRVYNNKSGRHLWTTAANERTATLKSGWNDEGVPWAQP